MTDSEFKALIKLLEDDDPEISDHVENRLVEMGGPAIPRLELAWENEGDITDVPSLYATNLAADGNSDRFLENADYVRLRFIRAGYEFPDRMLTKGIEALRIYANAENLFTWTEWTGSDPESAVNGVRRYPTPKVVSLGLEIEF